MSKHEEAIRQGARDLLEPGEEILSALVVSPRGSNTAIAGGLAAGEIGARWSNKNRGAAEDAGLVVKRSCGLALTDRRLLTVDAGGNEFKLECKPPAAKAMARAFDDVRAAA